MSAADYNRKAQAARQRAYRRLAAAHAEEFATLHDAERAEVGLAPADPDNWQPPFERLALDTCAVIAEYRGGLGLEALAAKYGVSAMTIRNRLVEAGEPRRGPGTGRRPTGRAAPEAGT